MDLGNYSADIDADASVTKSDDELEAMLAGGDATKHMDNGIDIDLEAEFDAQLNDLNRSSAVPINDELWPPMGGDSPTQNYVPPKQVDEVPEHADIGEGYMDADADIATEGSLDLEVDPGGDIVTEGSLDPDIGARDHQLHHLTDHYPPLPVNPDLGPGSGEPAPDPEHKPLHHDFQAEDPRDRREEEQQLMTNGIVDYGAEAGALTEGSLDLDVGGHAVDDDDDADVFESIERLDSPPVTYVNTTLVSNASSLGGHEPAPAHAQSLITRSRENVNVDVMAADREGDSGRATSAEEDITVIEPTAETKMLDHKGNGDAIMPVAVMRKGYPPPFPIGAGDENLKKGNWSHKMEFMFSIFCVVLTLDNFVKFPFLMHDNGGVVFLIPYMVALFVLVLPLVLLEISIGQFASSSFLTCWKFCPLLKGLGLGMLLHLFAYTFLSGPYSAYSLYYIFTVFQPGASQELLYMSCSNPWNTAGCTPLVLPNRTVVNGTSTGDAMVTNYMDATNETAIPARPENEYFRYEVMRQAGGTNDLEYPVQHLMIALGVAWIIVSHFILFGVKSFGKVAYVLVSAHFLLLIVLLIRGALLDGAMAGIKVLFWPVIDKLLETEVWKEAFCFAIRTFTPMCGILMSLSSYNKFHNNCFMDSVVLILVALFMNLLSAVTFFSYVGYGNTLVPSGDNILHEAEHSTGDTIFIMMAMVMGTLPHARIMSSLLFLFSFLASINFQVVVALSIVTAFLDLIGCRHSWKALVPASFLVSIACFGGGLLFVTPEGSHFMEVLDQYFLPHTQFVIAIIMPLAITWIYGTIPDWKFLRFQKDIKAMVGCFPIVFQGLFAGLEAIIVPIAMATLWVFSLYLLFKAVNFGLEPYQAWHVAVAIIFAFVPLIIGFLCGAVVELCKYISTFQYFTELFWLAAKPLPEWGPAVREVREEHNYQLAEEVGDAHDYQLVKPSRDYLVREETDRDFSCENFNNANDNVSGQRVVTGYSMSIHDEGSNPSSPREKREIVYPENNDIDHDHAVNSNATLPAGTPLLGLSLCSHETTL